MVFSNADELKNFLFGAQYTLLKIDNYVDTLMASPAAIAMIKSGVPNAKRIIKIGIDNCREAYSQGELIFARFSQQVLSARKNIGKMPDFL